MEKKLTKKDYYNMIMDACKDNAEIVSFCEHEIELLNKRVSHKSGPTKVQKENAVIKELLKGLLDDEPASIKEIQEADESLAELSSQKMAALLNQMVQEGNAAKVKEGKTVKFTLPKEEE